MSEEQELVYKGITVGHYSIAFDKVAFIETMGALSDSDEFGLTIRFSCGGYIDLRHPDAVSFYNAYRAYLGYFPEVDEKEELPL